MAFSDKLGNVFNKAKSGTIAASLGAKKKMKESSIKGEISSLESKMASVYTQIGREAYASFFDTLQGNGQLKEFSGQIKEIEGQITGKEKELAEAMAQFDAEIAEVKGEGQAEAAPDAQPQGEAQSGSGKVFCGQCGAENTTDSKFCNSCGAKLEKK